MFTSSNPEDQKKAAVRILHAVSNASITLPCANKLVTSITIGMTEATLNESLTSTINRADQAMYRGKAAGRNCVVVG